MIDFSSVLAFSQTHCVTICAVLVPVNLLATMLTIAITGCDRPATQIWTSCGFASLAALIMVLHVASWFVVGVVMIQTFVLLLLGGVCLAVNLWAVQHPHSLRWVLSFLGRSLKRLSAAASA
jgi:hypothetical protein